MCYKKLDKIGIVLFKNWNRQRDILYDILYTKYKQRQTKGYAKKTVPLIVQIYKNCKWYLESFNYNDKILIVNESVCSCSLHEMYVVVCSWDSTRVTRLRTNYYKYSNL